MDKKVAFITFEQIENKKYNTLGSSRIRANWVAQYWDEAEVYQPGQKYDVTIFQKAYFMQYIKDYKGLKIFDLCDPDWMINRPMAEVEKNIDGWTCPTEAIAKWLRNFSDKPVKVIPDRLDLKQFSRQKYHQGKAKTVVWFGYSSNQEVLYDIFPILRELKLNIIVISDNPQDIVARGQDFGVKVLHRIWDINRVNKDILMGDIVIMPDVNDLDIHPRYKYKSDNKTIHSWALGMPVATSPDELRKFIDEKARREESEKRLGEIINFDVKKSVEDYKKFIEELKVIKGGN